MERDQIEDVLNKPYAQELLTSGTPARFAYIALDGTPRVIPIGQYWNGTEFVICTTTNAAKVPALRADPMVSFTIDTIDPFPPKVLLVRGEARLETVDGVPWEYIEGGRRGVPAEDFPAWEEGVRGLYDQMVKIIVTPTWVKLLDFETTIPSNVQELVDQKMAAGSGDQ